MPETTLRLLRVDDAERLAQLQYADRAILAQWEPERPAAYYSTAGQRQLVADLLAGHSQGGVVPFAVEADGELVGRITIRSIVGGPFRKAVLGYWIASSATGRGHATQAVRLCLVHARSELRLHRMEASCQVANVASQRVLRRSGFTLMGVAHEHIYTAGRWHDELLWERVLRDQ